MATINVTTGTGSATVTVSTGARGPAGAAGEGVPAGGSTGQVLKKTSGTDYDTEWAAESGGSVSDTAYDATSWNGVTTIAPSKNAVRDKLETLGTAAYTAATAYATAAQGTTADNAIQSIRSGEVINGSKTINANSDGKYYNTGSATTVTLDDATGLEGVRVFLLCEAGDITIDALGSELFTRQGLTTVSTLTGGDGICEIECVNNGNAPIWVVTKGVNTYSHTHTAAEVGAAPAIETKTTNFTAEIGGRYITEGTVTITDPSASTAGQSYEVWIGSGTATIGGTAYSPSRFSIRRRFNGSAWATPVPYLTDALDFASGAKAAIRTNLELGSGNAVTHASLTLTAGTVTSSTPLFSATQTWNNTSNTFTGAVINITDTGSSSTSIIQDWQVGGSSRMSIRKDGYLTTATGFTTTGGNFLCNRDVSASRLDGFNLQASSIASAGTPIKNTPSLVWLARGWNTTATAASKNNSVECLLIPTTGATTSGILTFRNITVDGTANTTELFTCTTGGAFAVNGTVKTAGYTVATLPATPAAGMRCYVTDATATTFYSTVAGGGANVVPVFYNGANWVIA